MVTPFPYMALEEHKIILLKDQDAGLSFSGESGIHSQYDLNGTLRS